MLTPLEALKRTVEILEQLECKYCLVGGHAASLYRRQERLTQDVDFALVSNEPASSRAIAEECLRKLGFKPAIGFIPPGPHEPERESVCLISSAPPADRLTGLIDILLPVLPWVENAVKRAQVNKLNLVFAHVPVITAEDLIVAKCYALRNSPDRFQDLDDLKELLSAPHPLDADYLKKTLSHHSLVFPEPIKKYLPPYLSTRD